LARQVIQTVNSASPAVARAAERVIVKVIIAIGSCDHSLQMRRLLLLSAALALAAPAPVPEWHVIGPGGGGTLFYPTVSPHDPRTVLAGCDMTGGYVTHDGGTTWKMFNLGASPQFFVFDPRNAQVMYAEANGLFRSGDGGATWVRFLPRASEITRASMGDDHAEPRLSIKG
jgi:hypothetical protein